MEEKELGKIKSIDLKIEDGRFGLFTTLFFSSSGVLDIKSTWDYEQVEITERTKWTEEDRDQESAEIMRTISKLLNDAKVDSLSKLVNKPVEIILDRNMLKSWRILTEVL